jgi:hypothetical protein
VFNTQDGDVVGVALDTDHGRVWICSQGDRLRAGAGAPFPDLATDAAG